MRLWIPIAFAAITLLAYSLFYIMGSHEEQGATSFAMVNGAGLAAVLIGVLAAGIILRRSAHG